MYEAQVFITLPEFGIKSHYMGIWRREFESKLIAQSWAKFWAVIRDWITRPGYSDYGVYWIIKKDNNAS
jgi:hypothetical protein